MLGDHSHLPISSKSHSCLNDKSILPAPKRLGSWPNNLGPPVKSSSGDDITPSKFSQMNNPPRSDKPGQSSSSRRRSTRSPALPQHRRGKRRRRSDMTEEEDAERSPSPSPSELSSQGGTQEAGHSMSAEQHAGTAGSAPLKKKRTRTLTTPHQSAVLHSLLAQSRFPTTAMREDVGRQIGLSPRKVQVWFQNQRQKAKRPKIGAEPTLPQPPQFSPYSNPASSTYAMQAMGGGMPSTSVQREGSLQRHGEPGRGLQASLTGTIATAEHPSHDRRRSSYSEYPAPGPSGLVSQLTGPGVPGRTMLFDPYDPTPSHTSETYGPRTSYGISSLSRRPSHSAEAASSLPPSLAGRHYPHTGTSDPHVTRRPSTPTSSAGSPALPTRHRLHPVHSPTSAGQPFSYPAHPREQQSTSTPRPPSTAPERPRRQSASDDLSRRSSFSLTSGMVMADPGPSYLPMILETRQSSASQTHSSRPARFDPVRGSSSDRTGPHRPPSRMSP